MICLKIEHPQRPLLFKEIKKKKNRSFYLSTLETHTHTHTHTHTKREKESKRERERERERESNKLQDLI
jgi:hypothetical protein